MPENRFITKIAIPKAALILIPIAALVIFGAVRTLYYLDNPKVEFQNLRQDVTMATSTVFMIQGRIDPGYKLTLNNGEIFLARDGAFEKEVLLEVGFNTFVFKAKKVLGKEHAISKQIFYQKETEGTSRPREMNYEASQPSEGTTTTTTTQPYDYGQEGQRN